MGSHAFGCCCVVVSAAAPGTAPQHQASASVNVRAWNAVAHMQVLHEEGQSRYRLRACACRVRRRTRPPSKLTGGGALEENPCLEWQAALVKGLTSGTSSPARTKPPHLGCRRHGGTHPRHLSCGPCICAAAPGAPGYGPQPNPIQQARDSLVSYQRCPSVKCICKGLVDLRVLRGLGFLDGNVQRTCCLRRVLPSGSCLPPLLQAGPC